MELELGVRSQESVHRSQYVGVRSRRDELESGGRDFSLGVWGTPPVQNLSLRLCASARDKNVFYIIAQRRRDAEVGVEVEVGERWKRFLLGVCTQESELLKIL